MNRSSANHSRIVCLISMSEKVTVIGVTLMCQMCFFYALCLLNMSIGHVVMWRSWSHTALQPEAKTNESSKWLDSLHK